MKKIPLIMAASHTLARRFVSGCIHFTQGVATMLRGLLMLIMGVFLVMGGFISSLMLFAMPLQVFIAMLDPSPIPLFKDHDGVFFQGGHPTALSVSIYMGSVMLAYAIGLAYAIRSGVVAEQQAKIGPSLRLEAMLYAPIQVAGRAYMGFMNQIFSGKVWGWDGMMASPVVHGWKIALCCLAVPIHFVVLIALIVRPAFQRLANIKPKMARLPSFGKVLERLAQESPDVLARHEAKELGAQVSAGKESQNKPRL